MVDKYHPDSSANTICCNNLVEYFKLQGHQVDIVSVKWRVEDQDYSEYNGLNVIKLDTYQFETLKKCGKKYNARVWMDFPWLFRKTRSFLQKLKYVFKKNPTHCITLDTINYDNIFNFIKKANEHYDVLITFTMPAAFQVIGSELMKRGIADRWYPIFLDAFVYNKTMSRLFINKRKNIMKRVLKNATHIFMVEGILEENKKNKYNPEYHNKTTEIYIPMLKELDYPLKDKQKLKNTQLVYAGLFYPKIRNPEKMLDVLSNLDSDNVIKIFGDGCEDILSVKRALFPNGNLIEYGRITHEQCIKEISNCNILINLGNTITNQMPSKVFEYISFGKPIINFYFTEEDMCLEVFKKYPLAFNFNLNNYTDIDIENLKKFIQENKNKQLSFKEATAELVDYRVEEIAEKIYKVISK